ncbi:MAG: undecaprenyl-diphosphate phosphatase [Nanoarchaeota archaeon]
MLYEILMAIIQAVTEFLPISSSGHLALVGNLISSSDLFLITFLHFASLLAVFVFCRREIIDLLKFKKESKQMWAFLIIATIPAVIVGILLKPLIEDSLKSFLFLGISFVFTGLILLSTKKFDLKKKENKKLNLANSLKIGLLQCLALFPGVSRSGMAISGGIFSGLSREKAAKFSFLLFIPLAIGAMILEIPNFKGSFDYALLISFILCFILSLLFLNLLYLIVKKGYFWIFGFYCFALGILSFFLYFFL